jgi:hypothetical protein
MHEHVRLGVPLPIRGAGPSLRAANAENTPGACGRFRTRRGSFDERGQAIFEVAVGAFLIVLLLVAIAEMLSSLGKSSNSQRDVVIAQNLATKEIAALRAQASSTGGFPPADATTPSPLENATLTPVVTNGQNVGTTVDNGTTFYTYVVGGYCTSTTPGGGSVGNWVPYSSTSHPPTKTSPADYVVAVITRWGHTGSISSALNISNTDHVTSSSPHLVVTSSISIPIANESDVPTLSICPAVIT